jgi:hypothetical protein
MNRLFSVLSIFALVLVVTGFANAQRAVAPVANGTPLFPLEDIRPGMKGIAKTVFQGTETEDFGVEILGVLPGFPGPRQSAIIAN